jgi:excisionase family DNA binding protein
MLTTIDHAAKLAGVTARTIRRRIAAGRLTRHRRGGRTLVDTAELVPPPATAASPATEAQAPGSGEWVAGFSSATHGVSYTPDQLEQALELALHAPTWNGVWQRRRYNPWL